MFFGVVVAQLLSLVAAACVDGATVACTLPDCRTAMKFCDYGTWGPCECLVPEPPPLTCNDGNPCTIDTATSSGCTYTPQPGLSCSDRNACTAGDICTASGACVGTALTPAQLDDHNPCTVDSCDPATGVKHTPVAAGTSCSDGNACNGLEQCNSVGQCMAESPVSVDDGDPCTADSCDPASGVVQHVRNPHCGAPSAGAMPAVASNPMAQEVPQAPSAGGPVVVEHTGALAYQYGFELPAARGRYQPSLGLNYSSGIVEDEGYGVGWSLTMSFVERDITPAPRDSSGVSPERFWASIDGSRTLLVPTGGGKYRPEVIAPWMEWTYASGKWTAVDAQGNSFEFALHYAGSSGRGGRWYLTRVVDVDGNATEFTYLRDGAGAAAHLATISYNAYALAGVRYATRIVLSYAQRLPVRYAPVAGTISDRSWYLDSVLVQNDNGQAHVPIRGYRASYDRVLSHSTVLKAITRFGADPGRTLPPTTFDYGVPIASGYALADGVSFADPAANAAYRAWVDLNGDSIPDRVWKSSTKLWWAPNMTPAGGTNVSFGASAEIVGSEGMAWIEAEPEVSGSYSRVYSAFRDLNGDGFADQITANPDFTISVRFGGLINDVPGFAAPVQVALPAALTSAYNAATWGGTDFALGVMQSPSSTTTWTWFSLVDVNRDGLLDFVMQVGCRTYLGYPTSGGAWAFSDELVLSPGGSCGLADDANADGFTDVVSEYYLGRSFAFDPARPNALAYFLEGQSVTPGMPVNWFPANGSLDVPDTWYSCPEDPKYWCYGLGSYPDNRQRSALADLDGDGYSDTLYKTVLNEVLPGDSVAACSAEPCPIAIYWGSPSGHLSRSLLLMPDGVGGRVNLFPASESISGAVQCLCRNNDDIVVTTRPGTRLQSGWEEEFVDLNGDGVLDHVYVGGRVALFYRGSNGLNGRPTVLQAVITPGGARFDVVYAPATQFGASFRDASPNVVASITVSQPSGGGVPVLAPNTTHYWYSGGTSASYWFEPLRREPRGFEQTWAQSEVGGVVRSTRWVTTSHALSGSPLAIEWGAPRAGEMLPSGAPASSVFRRATYAYGTRKSGSTTCDDHGTEPAAGSYPLVPVTTSFRLSDIIGGSELTSERTMSCADVDDYGNVLRVRSDPDVNNGGDESYELARFDADAACKSCVVETRLSRDYAGVSLLRRSLYRYDSPAQTSANPLPEMRAGNGHLNYVSRWVIDPRNGYRYEIEEAVAYNANGTVASRTSGSVTESYTYDLQQQRVTATTRTDGATTLVSTAAYDPSTGYVSSVEGPYPAGWAGPRAMKAFAYDTFGRVIAVGRSISGAVVTGTLSATEYVDSSPPVVRNYSFAAPLTTTVGTVPSRADVKETISYMDGLGRVVQVRERVGGAGGADPASGITQILAPEYLVTSAIQLDGAGRVVASLASYKSWSGAYERFEDAAVASGRATRTWFDARGWITCSATGVYAALQQDGGACTSSFDDNSSYRVSTAYRYRGIYRSPRHFVGVEIVPPSMAAIAGTETVFGPAGRIDRSVDAYGNEVIYTLDLLGQVTATTRRASGGVAVQTATVEYDSLGRVVSEYDPNWSGVNYPSRIFSYDPQGRVTRVQLPISEQWSSEDWEVRPEIHYMYESLGRLTRVIAIEPAAEPVDGGLTFTERTISQTSYDLPYRGDQAYQYTFGQVSWVRNGKTTIAFGYDANGVPVRRDQWFVGLSGPFTSTATTTHDGRLLSTSFSSSYSKTVTTNHRYDSMLRPVAIDVGAVRAWEVVGTYDPLGRVRDVRSNQGAVLTHREYGIYNGELKLHTVGTAAQQLYGVENVLYVGGKLQVARDPTTATDYSYNYDANGRLIRANAVRGDGQPAQPGLAQLYDEAYAFTKPSWPVNASMGNLERVTQYQADGRVVARDHEYTNDRLTATKEGATQIASYRYDDQGRVLSAVEGVGRRAFAYDVEGHLTSITSSVGSSDILEYDPTGQLMFRKAGTTVYYYVGGLATVTGSVLPGCTVYGCAVMNVKVGVHVQLGTARVATARAPAPADQAAPESDLLYYHRDGAGSVIATTLSGGLVGEKYRYLPYGALDRRDVVTGNAASELGYTGALKLSGSLLHLNARVYDTSSRRFLQADVVDSLRYTYAAGDPVGLVDPSGLRPMERSTEIFTPLPSWNGSFLLSPGWLFTFGGQDGRARMGNPELLENAERFFGGAGALTSYLTSIPSSKSRKAATGEVMQIRELTDGALMVSDSRGAWVVAPGGSPAGFSPMLDIRSGSGGVDAHTLFSTRGMTLSFDVGVYSRETAYSAKTTKDFFFRGPTRLARSAVGMITGGAVAKSFGTVPLGELLRSVVHRGLGPPGIATLGGVGGAVGAFGLHVVVNGLVAGSALYGGIELGSHVFGAWQATTVYRGCP